MSRLLLALLILPTCIPSQPPPQPAPPPEEAEPVIRIDVELVNIFFSVRDKKGAYAPGLKAEHFDVFEDGKKQEIKSFTRETDLPLTLGLLVDVSKSQENLIEVERAASRKFFAEVLTKKDLAFIISFGADAELLQDLTNSIGLLEAGLRELRINAGAQPVFTPSTVPVPGGPRGTILYDAVWLAAKDKLQREVGRKAMVVITDGVDFGSRIKLDNAVEAAQRADAIVYPILYEDPRYTMYAGYSGGGSMNRLAQDTGGRMFRVGGRQDLASIYAQIQEEMRTQYAIAYASSNPNRDGGFRRVEIKPKQGNLRVQARKGYYAPKD